MAGTEVVWRYRNRVGDGCVCEYEWCCKCVICFVYNGHYSTSSDVEEATETLSEWKSWYGW